MRTAVLAAQVCKYVALFSSKGYAVGAKFREWMLAEAEVLKEEAGGEDDEELLGCIEDLMAICGSRDYVFFMNAAVVERLAQAHSLRSYLEEERDLGGEAGGKLRASILTGFGSEGIMATVRTMARCTALGAHCTVAMWPHRRTRPGSARARALTSRLPVATVHADSGPCWIRRLWSLARAAARWVGLGGHCVVELWPH